MERYAPTLLDLAPRDMISRAIITEIRSGNGARGDGKIDDYVFLDATKIGKDVLEKKLPDITGFSRTYLGIDPVEKPIPIQPTAHYAMGGSPRTSTDGCSPTAAERSMMGCTRRENVRASQCTARTGSGRTASWTSWSSAGGPESTSPLSPRPRSSATLRETRRSLPGNTR